MYFNSLNFLFFISISVLIYLFLPLKIRKTWLLIVSFVFYGFFGWKYIGYLFSLILVTYILGRMLESRRDSKIIIAFGALCCIGLLGVFKYTDFILTMINSLLEKFSSQTSSPAHFDLINLIAPVGVSFYTLQALGYLIDIKRKRIEPEKNIITYALFISFFPQICSGPIGRAPELIPQFKNIEHVKVEQLKRGLLHIAYGLFLKIVVADRIANLVDPIFDGFKWYSGMQLILAVMLFGIEIYCDFCGYTTMALGCGELFGIELRQNFKQPYLSISVKEFWRKWHISLTSWFTDYLYISLGGNRKGAVRRYINVMIVFMVSGLWHGAGVNFIIWGGLNGLFLVLEGIILPKLSAINDSHGNVIDINRGIFKLFRGVLVFLLIDFAWLFFRVTSLQDIGGILLKMVREFRLSWFVSENMFDTFTSASTLGILAISMLIVLLVDVYEQKTGEDIYNLLAKQPVVFRWIIYIVFLFIIMLWGVYGQDYAQTQFIYFQF